MAAIASVPVVLLISVIGYFIFRTPPPAPPPVVIVTPPLPTAIADAGEDAGVDGGEAEDGGLSDGGSADGGLLEDGGLPDAGPPKKVRKKSNEAPLPPWLRH
jgi:hypothetical protein